MIVLITASLLAYFTLRAIYRLYLHPLSKFPGPKWAAITDYWELYQDYFRKEGGFLFIELDRLHEEYGMKREIFIKLIIFSFYYPRPHLAHCTKRASR